ncbi:MAG: hypothetical protein ACR2RA_19385 [Geminicoccaceae bacterium]
MNIRFLTPKQHGLVDYTAAAGLILLPFILNLGASTPLAFWLSVAAGITVIGYSLLTSYSYGVAAVVPFKVHLIIDFVAAAAFAAVPFVLGFQGIDAAYYWTLAAAVFLIVAVSQVSETDRPVDKADGVVA